MTSYLQTCRIKSKFQTVSDPAPPHLLGMIPLRNRGGLARKNRRMMRTPSHWRLFISPTGAAATILALGLFAPPIAQAGCSHLVTSDHERRSASSLFDAVMPDLAGPTDAHPMPPLRRPCSGAGCSGQPAVPAVPIALSDRQVEPWAWFVSVPNPGSFDSARLVAETDVLRPLRRGNDVFHPPRGFLPAR
jgi:hypothetical protein